MKSFILEIIISFLLMFIISGVTTDTRAIGELAGIAVGSTILLNVLIVGPISGASMNPSRSLGPAIAMHNYKAIWAYILVPIIGELAGGFTYNLIRFIDKSLREITKHATEILADIDFFGSDLECVTMHIVQKKQEEPKEDEDMKNLSIWVFRKRSMTRNC